MKKVLALFTAVILIASTSFTALASEGVSTDYVLAQINKAVEYLTDGVDSYGVNDAIDFYTIARSGAELGELGEGFINDVKANLDANYGKIVSAYGESLATYGAVILSLSELGEDPSDFYGYDITAAFSAMDPTAPPVSAYYYRVIIPATIFCDDEAFATAVCDTFINDNYTMGMGMGLYGYYCCDNTAYFINALSTYADMYPEVMADAFNVLESYRTDGGYYSDDTYVTYANVDSTALALMAYSSMLCFVDEDEFDDYAATVNEIYDMLCTYESEDTGVFISSYTNDKDYLSTKDALMGLEEYFIIAAMQEFGDDPQEEPESKPTAPQETTPSATQKPSASKPTAKKPATSKKSPSTGAASISFAVALAGASVVTLIKKSTDND